MSKKHTTSKPTSFADLRSTVRAYQGFADTRQFSRKHNYSSFWMGGGDDRFYGFDSAWSAGGGKYIEDMSKMIRLVNYRRAITNFVKIVTGQDIPVKWLGSESHTDGKSITLTTKIKDDNFDVVVGLALHEASHIKLSDFEYLASLAVNPIFDEWYRLYPTCTQNMQLVPYFKGFFNWIEDRRIDHFIFSTSPGYKAYYHKMYDHYFNDKMIAKAFLSKEFRKVNPKSYELHIVNMINPLFRPNALPGLEEITKIIDLPNISRMTSTDDAFATTVQVFNVLLPILEAAAIQKGSSQEEMPQQLQDMLEDILGAGGGDTQFENNPETTDDADELLDLDNAALAAIDKALTAQRDFTNGSQDIKESSKLNKKLAQKLENLANETVDVMATGDGLHTKINTVIVRLDDRSTTSNLHKCITEFQAADRISVKRGVFKDFVEKHPMLHEVLRADKFVHQYTQTDDYWTDHLNRCFDPQRDRDLAAVRQGLTMGALLGKQLRIHSEARERIDTRLHTGKIDSRRIAHAGYGMETIFQQKSVDAYKNANIHISLDASGSMDGEKWTATIQMAVAIAKAATYSRNINVQISLRGTHGSDALLSMVYDSRTCDLNHLAAVMSAAQAGSLTPEGLCYEAMIKSKLLIPGTPTLDSYLLNISDGQPSCDNYEGNEAVEHTRRQVTAIRGLNIKVISFFISTGDITQITQRFQNDLSGTRFRRMYGSDASVVDPQSVMSIAKALNKSFLSAKVTV